VNKYGKLPSTENDCMRELGIVHSADKIEIKKKWRELSQIHHPDKGGDRELFERVTHAYKFLTNPEYRSAWEKAQASKGSPDHSTNLDMIMTLPVSFADAFFGKLYVCTFNIQSFDEEFKPTPLDSGEIAVQTINIELSPGLFAEQQLIFDNCGHQRGEVRGKALIIMRPLPHPKFRMDGIRITAHERVPLDVMLRGGKIDVETMRGIKKVKVPPGSMQGDTIEIEGAGLSVMGQIYPHVITLDPILPTRKDLQTKKVWQRLRIKWETAEPIIIKPEPHGFIKTFFIGGPS
jgi:curved DNA-binding protein